MFFCKKQALLILSASLVPALMLSSAVSQEDLESDAPVEIEIKELNENGENYHGKRVKIEGFMRSGFNGGAPECYVAARRGNPLLEELILVNAPSCSEGDQSDYKAGRATIVGTFHWSPEPFIWLGAVYQSQLSDSVVEWK